MVFCLFLSRWFCVAQRVVIGLGKDKVSKRGELSRNLHIGIE